MFQLALGVMAAAGGFVDIGDLVFATQSGALFGYSLLWALAIGVVGIIVFSEMCGRIGAIAKKPVFVMVKERYPKPLALIALVSAEVVNLMTCAAEIGGVALVLRLLIDQPYSVLIIVAAVVVALLAYILPFEAIENVFGWLGLTLVVFLVVAVANGIDWKALATGLIPGAGASADPWRYAYFAVGMLSATLMPYEVYFYSSGGIEQGWGEKDLKMNTLTAIFGYTLGSLLVVGIIAVAAQLYLPGGIEPETLASTALAPLVQMSRAAVLVALAGMFFTVGGAAIETSFSGAYNLAQYLGWRWGKQSHPRKVPRFTLSWLGMLVAGTAIIITGIDAVKLTEYAVIFSVILMPLTYVPILLVANDPEVMGKHVNKGFMKVLGWVFLVLISIVAVSAIPLMIITKMGEG